MQIFALKGTTNATLTSASDFGGQTNIRLVNVTSTARLITVATVGANKPTFPGTFKLAGGESIVVVKGGADTVATDGSNGNVEGTAVQPQL